MIELIATVESINQASQLVHSIDTIFFGEETFGLRLPTSFSRKEQAELINIAHSNGKKAMVAVNGIMHPEKMACLPAYLSFLKEQGADVISLGDPGVIYLMRQQPALQLPFIYDGETMVTSARQINFWAKKGAIGAVLAREVPFEEMKKMATELRIPTEILVYGATCIHQSKRPLLQNYYNFTQQKESTAKERGLFLAEPKKETHYSIFEDSHGTHIFANNDINLMKELADLHKEGYHTWKLDGLYTPEENFLQIVQLFAEARELIESGCWDVDKSLVLEEQVRHYHPQERGLDTGFYFLDPEDIK